MLRIAIGDKTKHVMIQLSLFYVVFYAIYTLNVYLDSIGLILNDNSILSVIIGLCIRLLTWTLPIFLLVSKPFDYLELKNNISKGVTVGFTTGIVLCLLQILAMYLLKGSVVINLNLSKHLWWEVILFVGLSEEVVFRGFLLQKIEAISNFWIANIMSSLLFVCTHFPYWILISKFGIHEILLNSLWAFIFSLFLGFIFNKTKSLWSCIIIHSFHNFVSLAMKLYN